ncbi:iron (metal) dependent repressor, DtxR family [Chlorobium limicola DSM 245]|uniref:Transcriptional regulator MntR n=1 Tax=Chlorobium limicola (strain DSM 245 / NBRC 103803 / 6330) TaxID=290315 RepID=B3EDI8_CHLL2|nr:metal-dependent transcriptional regulator [Chlorobium limicola]ACD90613.1 iron (metal) dependent repressor, DtxR family [Chlorobium limicola DSM 245]
MPSESSEMYIQTIFRLTRKQSNASISEVAAALGFSLSTVSEKVKHLTHDGYLVHEWREHVSLSEKGQITACRILRKRRLIETFLYKFAGYGLHEVHDEACRLEHVISERLADAIEGMLGFPKTDPHGHDIPSKKGILPERKLTTLYETADEKSVTVAALQTTDPELLKYINDMGLTPGIRCQVIDKAPFKGPVRIKVNDRILPLSVTMASLIEVVPSPSTNDKPVRNKQNNVKAPVAPIKS